MLIFNNANINLKDEDNQTAFHIACEVGSHRIAKSLLEKGAKINEAGGKQELTPLHVAVKNGHYDIAKLLLENGAEVDCRGQFGQTPLHIAVKNGHYDIAKLLLENGADINAKNQLGFTALHNAVKSSDVSVYMVKLLLENGADINMKDSSNKTALDIVEKKLQNSSSNQTLLAIKFILEKKQEIEASSTLRIMLVNASKGEKPQALKALSIDQLTQSKNYQSPGVD